MLVMQVVCIVRTNAVLYMTLGSSKGTGFLPACLFQKGILYTPRTDLGCDLNSSAT